MGITDYFHSGSNKSVLAITQAAFVRGHVEPPIGADSQIASHQIGIYYHLLHVICQLLSYDIRCAESEICALRCPQGVDLAAFLNTHTPHAARRLETITRNS
jgi:hypothetical protein